VIEWAGELGNIHWDDAMDTVYKLLHSVKFAFAFGAVVVVLVSTLAYILVGWLGIALVGLMGVYISIRIDLHDGNAVADFDYGSSAVTMLAKQIRERDQAQNHEREKLQKERSYRKKLIYLLNTLWLAMMALGFVMFSTRQV